MSWYKEITICRWKRWWWWWCCWSWIRRRKGEHAKHITLNVSDDSDVFFISSRKYPIENDHKIPESKRDYNKYISTIFTISISTPQNKLSLEVRLDPMNSVARWNIYQTSNLFRTHFKASREKSLFKLSMAKYVFFYVASDEQLIYCGAIKPFSFSAISSSRAICVYINELHISRISIIAMQ